MDNLLASANEENFQSILVVQAKDVSESSSRRDETRTDLDASVDSSAINPSVAVGAGREKKSQIFQSSKMDFSDILIRYFNIKEYINELKDILAQYQIRNLYVFIDDFSELPEDAMEIVVDTLLAPLNNWSDEFIKFKIAAYPGRIYLGEIDKTKIDEIYLDSYKLYANGDITKEPVKGMEFTKRLIEKRIQYYCNRPVEYFFLSKTSDNNDIWATLYEATMGNPRMLGYLLSFSHETNLLHQEKIDSKSINMASERYFNDKVEPFFQMKKFLHESFQEKSSTYGLKELLEKLILESKDIEKNKDTPSSHFHVNQKFDSILSTLELNFFLTKRQECLDQDRKKVSIYCFHFGLCQKFRILFSRHGYDPNHFIKRWFDFSAIIQEYMQNNKELVCEKCKRAHDLSMLESVKQYDWLCPECKQGKCKLLHNRKKYKKEIEKIDKDMLLPETEMGILSILDNESRALFPKEVAMELDCSHQLVGQRARKLSEKKLITREKEGNRRKYQISALGKKSYFPKGEREVIRIS